MKEIIVKIKNIDDLKEKYSNEVSSDLIKYIVNEARFEKEKFKIIVRSEFELRNIEKLIRDGFLKYLSKSERVNKIYDVKQGIFFLLGVICLFISTLIKFEVLKEIIIIAGWVGIWEVVDIAINAESKLKRDRRIIKKLLNSQITFEKINQ